MAAEMSADSGQKTPDDFGQDRQSVTVNQKNILKPLWKMAVANF